MTTDSLMGLLESLGIEKLRQRNHNITGCCPIHGESRPSWGIRIDPPHVYGCFSCGAGGVLSGLLAHHYKWSFKKVTDLLGRRTPEETDRILSLGLSDEIKRGPDVPLFPEMMSAFPMTDEGLAYLRRRGFSDLKLIHSARIGFDKLGNRIVFPWFVDSELVTITGRAIDDNPAKIIAYAESAKANWLYSPTGTLAYKRLILVEGELDALSVRRAGYRNVAALGQGRLTDGHRALLSSINPEELILFFDCDRTGIRLTSDVAARFRSQTVVSSVNYSTLNLDDDMKLDPGALNPAQVRFLISNRGSATWLGIKL